MKRVSESDSMKNEKLLTISVAAYNVQDYLEQNLNSIIKSRYLNLIEVFVVDDGGNDNSLSIAKEYEKQYPDSIFAVHKENGGYGTTVNYSIAHATGKYFRLLDGDDWFNTDGLDLLIEHIMNYSPDWIVTKTDRVQDGAGVILDPEPQWLKYTNEKVLQIEDIPAEFQVGMWESTYRTDLLKEHAKEFPSRTLYTDILYMCYPLAYAKTVSFLNTVLYCYRLGRDGQSVSRESRIKHYKEQLAVVDLIKQYYVEADVAHKAELIKRRFTAYYKWQILCIMLLPASMKNLNHIRQIERDTKRDFRDFYDAGTESKNVAALRYTGYLAYWPLVWHGIKNW